MAVVPDQTNNGVYLGQGIQRYRRLGLDFHSSTERSGMAWLPVDFVDWSSLTNIRQPRRAASLFTMAYCHPFNYLPAFMHDSQTTEQGPYSNFSPYWGVISACAVDAWAVGFSQPPSTTTRFIRFPGTNDGGKGDWSSPVVAAGWVCLFCVRRTTNWLLVRGCSTVQTRRIYLTPGIYEDN